MSGQIDPESLTWRITPDLLGVTDASGYFKHTNPAWLATLGRSPEDIEQRAFFDFVHPEDIQKSKDAFASLRQNKPVLGFENRCRHKEGNYRWLSWNAVPENDLFFCSARDVTEAKDNEASLKTREQEAVLREQFVAVLGHDLRNPVTAVDACMRILLSQPQSELSIEIIKQTQKSVLRMSDLINNVTDFARIKLGQGFAIKRVDNCSLQPVLEQAVEEIRLGNPGVTIQEEYAFDFALSCDPPRVAQLVSNLVANAVSHGRTDKPIKVTGRIARDIVIISVTNFGKQMTGNAMPTLFEPFYRDSEQGSSNGLGLGLFIAKQIAWSHAGTLNVSSDTEQTCFEFMMPAYPSKAADPES